jgi:hypothetical protein
LYKNIIISRIVDVLDPKTTENKRILRDILRRQYLSFRDFLAVIETVKHLTTIPFSDFRNFDYNTYLQPHLPRHITPDSIRIAHRILNTGNTKSEIETEIYNNEMWYYVVLQRLYHHYIDRYYDVKYDLDGYGDSVNDTFDYL